MKKFILVFSILVFIAVLIPVDSHSSTITHKVKQGDNLYNLSKKYHVSVDQLKDLNNLRSTKLNLGQTLFIKTDSSNISQNTDTGRKKSSKKKKVEEVVVTENDGELQSIKLRKVIPLIR